MRILILLLLAGCPGLRHHAPRSAHGHVDLDVPLRGERGDAAAHEAPTDPGEHQLGIAPGASFQFGSGRVPISGEDAALEAAVQLHLSYGERPRTGDRGALGFPLDSWGATLGWAYVQSGTSEMITGPLYLEGTRVFYGLALGAGLAVYPDAGDLDVGPQVTLQALVFAVRMRYVQDTGFEVFGGYQLFLPASLTWSR